MSTFLLAAFWGLRTRPDQKNYAMRAVCTSSFTTYIYVHRQCSVGVQEVTYDTVVSHPNHNLFLNLTKWF